MLIVMASTAVVSRCRLMLVRIVLMTTGVRSKFHDASLSQGMVMVVHAATKYRVNGKGNQCEKICCCGEHVNS
jgi:hypothetical protein